MSVGVCWSGGSGDDIRTQDVLLLLLLLLLLTFTVEC